MNYGSALCGAPRHIVLGPTGAFLLMTSSSKIRIYELSKELGLENKDVLNAAEKLSIAAKSHSSSISDEEAKRIRDLLRKGLAASSSPQSNSNPSKAILSLKKAPATESKGVSQPNQKATISITNKPRQTSLPGKAHRASKTRNGIRLTTSPTFSTSSETRHGNFTLYSSGPTY